MSEHMGDIEYTVDFMGDTFTLYKTNAGYALSQIADGRILSVKAFKTYKAAGVELKACITSWLDDIVAPQ